MLNLLPQKEKARFIYEYHIRLARAVFFFVCVLLVGALIGLYPTYVNKKEVTSDLVKEREFAEQKNTQSSLAKADAATAQNKALAGYLAARISTIEKIPPASFIVKEILAKAGSGISVMAIDVDGNHVSVRGVASTRTELISFHQRLMQEEKFKGAVLPIGDIAKSVKPAFAIQITLP